MVSLLIDTATEQGIVAFVDKDKVLWEEEIPVGLHHSRFVMPAIVKGSRVLSLEPKDLAFVCCGVGPGSYTGMRVAASITEVISYAHKIPLVAVSTLEGFASGMQGDYAVLLDAKIGGVYLLLGNRKGDEITINTLPEVITAERVPAQLRNVRTIVTPHLEALQKKLFPFAPENAWIWEKGKISSHLFAASAYGKFLKGECSHNNTAELLYLTQSFGDR